jgi:hypothetical protein
MVQDPEPQRIKEEPAVFYKFQPLPELECKSKDNLHGDVTRKYQDQIDFLELSLKKARKEINYLRAENSRLRLGRSPTIPAEVYNDPTYNDPRLYDPLLKKIIRARDEGRAALYTKQQKPQVQDLLVNGTNGVSDSVEVMDTTTDMTTTERASAPTTPAVAPQSAVTKSTGWGLSSMLSMVASVFASPAPATAPHQAPRLSPQQVEEIGLALAPDATPTRPPRRRPQPKPKPKPKTKKPRKSDSARRAIVNQAVEGVQANQKEIAEAWAKKVASKIAIKDGKSPQPGMKRQALGHPMRIKDVKEIPARRPWEPTGSYGLLSEFFDDSDSESDDEREVPGWFMIDTLAKEQPPLKKRKTGSDASSLDVTQSSLTTSALSDSQGHSASLSDVHPRPSHVPSPMFENPTTHHNGGNVFEERQTQSPSAEERAAARATFEKELRKTGHVEGSGTFCVPEDFSSDDDDDDNEEDAGQGSNTENAAGGLPWTQAPPAAPTPAHAQLPVPVTATPSVPEIQSAPKTVAVDPVETARARAMKHTPAKPSRLREAMIPSPSLRSDSGSSPAIAALAAAPAVDDPESDHSDPMEIDAPMPHPVPLDLGDPRLLTMARNWTGTSEFKARCLKLIAEERQKVSLVDDE